MLPKFDGILDIRKRCGHIAGILRMVQKPQKEHCKNRSDGTQRYQTEAVVLGMFITSNGSKTDTKRHDKRNCHGAGSHPAGIKCDSDKIPWNKQGQYCHKDIKKD